MSYGSNPFGTTPFGGFSLESGGVTLTGNPAPNGTGAATFTDVQILLYSTSEFELYTLQLYINGARVIRDGVVQAPFAGTVVNEGVNLSINITSHPQFLDGSTVFVSPSVRTLAGNTPNLDYIFHTGSALVDWSESLSISESIKFGQFAQVTDHAHFTEGISPFVANASETIVQTLESSVQYTSTEQQSETISIFESIQIGALRFYSIDETTVGVEFPEVVDIERFTENCFDIQPGEEKAFPVRILSVSAIQSTLQTGSTGQVLPSGSGRDTTSLVLDTVIGSFTPDNLLDYIYVEGGHFDANTPYRIVSYSGSQVTLDRPLTFMDASNGIVIPPTNPWDPPSFIPGTGTLTWTHKSAAIGAIIKVTPTTLGRTYLGKVLDVTRKASRTKFSALEEFEAIGVRPKIHSASYNPEDGSVVVVFNRLMRLDSDLVDSGEYLITGPTAITVLEVVPVDPYTVSLKTSGFTTSGVYLLVVNAIGTPKDEQGNSIDPLFNQATILASIPITTRSLFTDKGPIAKPELVLQSGSSGVIQFAPSLHFGSITLNEIIFPGGSFTLAHVGLYIRLSGSTLNSGDFKVIGLVTPTRLKLQATFHLPDPSNGHLSWSLFDPRTGEIANDPSDVEVLVDGLPVHVQQVTGLLGQVVLDSPPNPGSNIKINYSWVRDPVVDVRRLNSKEFRLNNSVNTSHSNQHNYKYRNVLADPQTFVPETLSAAQLQPLLRDLHYRAYERAYTASLNDSNTLVLNSPFNRVAFPPLSRTVSETTVSYTADVLPEVDLVPWVRKGGGLSQIISGSLVVTDNTAGPFPVGLPLFWTRGVDLTFPHIYASTWRVQINSTTPNGVFTGIAVGWSDGGRVVVLGYLLDNGVPKIGFLKKGVGNAISSLSSWSGGIDSTGTATGLPFNFDWTFLHSYRLFQGADGVARFYVDSEVVASLRILPDELPFLNELNDPFDQVQNSFFGSISREAINKSTWDFVRYIATPLNPEQSNPSIFVNYSGDDLPEDNAIPWIPIGYHGNEAIISNRLFLDSTSATIGAIASEVGLVGGDFRGFSRLEPLLSVSSGLTVDVDLNLRTFTHGITPNAVMVAIDDSKRLIQLCFFPTKAQPKISYPGRSLPQDAPIPWTSLGTATASMFGRALRIEDSSINTGRVFAIPDQAPLGSDNRILETGLDWISEFKFQVQSYTADTLVDNFCGVTVDLFDGTRTLGLLTRKDPISGALQVGFHSDGIVRPGALFNFNWFDNQPHVYRIAKSTSGNLVSLFIDNKFIGSYNYSGFDLASGSDSTYSFGSATLASQGSLSVVDWHYVNLWRSQPSSGVRHYAGFWKGFSGDSLLGYHLPLKSSGTGVLAGNSITDDATNFVTSGVLIGDDLIIDSGVNQGVYQVASVGANVLTTVTPFPQVGSTVTGYRVAKQSDITSETKYRIVRDNSGVVTLFSGAGVEPQIRLDYTPLNLPPSSVGVPYVISEGLPSISWGSFDPTNLSQTSWASVQYGIARHPGEVKIVPPHQVLNQRNVMSSPEHLFGNVVHQHTQFSSSSTGIPTPWEEYSAKVSAFTQLNEGTPLVPQTQTYEVRKPKAQVTFLATLNNPQDVLNDSGFQLNDATSEVKVVVPDDVLYTALQVQTTSTGEENLITPFSDLDGFTQLKKLSWQKMVCAKYDGSLLPEQSVGFGTSWVLDSDDPSQVSATVSGGVLTYSVGSTPTQTVYRNATPLTDPVGLSSVMKIRLKVLNDASLGTGDSGIRVGFSALGLTAALAFISTPFGEREVHLVDLNTNAVLGSISFDYLDGGFHTYQLIKDVEEGIVNFLIDP